MEKTMEKIVALAKARGFVYPGSEIYGGLANTWDYGNLGVELKNNVKKAWWQKFITSNPYNVGVDCAILMNPQTWVASGHLGGFSDPLMDCKECHERFGTSVITGTIRGENKAKLRSYGVDRYSTFGMCRQMSESFIKGVIDKMLLEGYLRETDDMYRILKLTETSDMLISGEEHLIMKWSERKEEFKKEKRTPKSLDADGLMLFERLRMLRIDIARNENVPPYIVFSDKALTDMCIKRPHTKAEMLNVNGVGENKYERYGKEFLKCIKEHENQEDTHG